MNEEKARRKIVEVGIELKRKGLTYGSSGNISIRIGNKILITPSAIPYEKIEPKNIVEVDFEGNEKGGKASIETPMHLAIYRKRDDINSIIHFHAPYSMACAASVNKIPIFLDELFSHIGGSLDVAEYAVPGSRELAENVSLMLSEKNAALLRCHGAICCGRSLEEAMELAEIVERICKIYVLSSIIGEPKELPEEGKKYQRDLFRNYRTFL